MSGATTRATWDGGKLTVTVELVPADVYAADVRAGDVLPDTVSGWGIAERDAYPDPDDPDTYLIELEGPGANLMVPNGDTVRIRVHRADTVAVAGSEHVADLAATTLRDVVLGATR